MHGTINIKFIKSDVASFPNQSVHTVSLLRKELTEIKIRLSNFKDYFLQGTVVLKVYSKMVQFFAFFFTLPVTVVIVER